MKPGTPRSGVDGLPVASNHKAVTAYQCDLTGHQVLRFDPETLFQGLALLVGVLHSGTNPVTPFSGPPD